MNDARLVKPLQYAREPHVRRHGPQGYAEPQIGSVARREVVRRYFGFPLNLPRLAVLHPPGGNSRPAGVHDSFYERRGRGDLAEFY